MPKYRSGAAAIESAAASRGGGGFRGFVPEIFWKEDGEKKYVLILTPTDEVGAFDLHEWIPVKGEKANGETYEYSTSFMSRKDPYIGEDYDKIEDDLDRRPKTRCMGVGVELEPVMEVVKGRKRPTGFSVKTDSFTRNTDDGEEQVTYPLIGIISQSSKLMWSPLNSLDASQGPLEDLPLEIVRRIPGGNKADTSYEFIPFMDIPVDLSGVVEYVDGISYLKDSLSDIIAELESLEEGDDLAAAQAVARALFEKRIEELADAERYEELLGDVDELPAPPWGGGKKDKKTSSKKTTSRPARKPQRKKKEEEAPSEDGDDTSDEAEPTKTDRFAKLKARVESGKESE